MEKGGKIDGLKLTHVENFESAEQCAEQVLYLMMMRDNHLVFTTSKKDDHDDDNETGRREKWVCIGLSLLLWFDFEDNSWCDG